MSRAAFQILVIPFHHNKNGEIEFAVLKRSDEHYWQFVAGGGENNESPIDTAKRETFEEIKIPASSKLIKLDSKINIPVVFITGEFTFGKDVYVIPEYAFGIECENFDLNLSEEHIEYKWLNYNEAMEILKYDSNKNALWELNERLKQT
jgi:dATP pyrophosphohydrolase